MTPEIKEPSTTVPPPGNNAARPASLALRRVQIDTYHENVAYMHRDCAVYRAEGFKALSKVEIRANGQRILASLNVVDDEAIVACEQRSVPVAQRRDDESGSPSFAYFSWRSKNRHRGQCLR